MFTLQFEGHRDQQKHCSIMKSQIVSVIVCKLWKLDHRTRCIYPFQQFHKLYERVQKVGKLNYLISLILGSKHFPGLMDGSEYL